MKTDIERFWAKVQKSDGCWEWQGSRFAKGYGKVTRNSTTQPAHRLSYTYNVGPIPPGMMVCHHCDNPPCVRPDHLFLGTPADNMADKYRKGRQNCGRGDTHSCAKLTGVDVLAIRALAAAGVKPTELAGRFGVSRSAIKHIISGYSWRHLPLSPGAQP